MEQKRVSFKVAKAIKESGYPQMAIGTVFITETFMHNGCSFEAGDPITRPFGIPHKYLAAMPTYLDVWLWLWREKGIEIELCGSADQRLEDCYKLLKWAELDSEGETNMNLDPEEAIISAIEYLVDNDLIK